MESIVKKKRFEFAIRIVKLSQFLKKEKNERVLSKQILRSGTAIGALIREAEFGQSKADFISKMSIALKEANETEYWISLLKDTGYINEGQYKNISKDAGKLIKLLISRV
jgi:four helix bundle protein